MKSETQSISNAINVCSKNWQLSAVKQLSHEAVTQNYVAKAYSALLAKEVVLKIVWAKTNEFEALRYFRGPACVQLLDYNVEHNALLLEYIRPGTSLKQFFPDRDDFAIEVTASIIKALHQNKEIPKSHHFKTIDQWLNTLYTHTSIAIPKNLLYKAQELGVQLLQKAQPRYVLHGDLHHENILQKDSHWVAIDPKGVIGPLEYELGRFIMNPMPNLLNHPSVVTIIKNRVNRFSQLFEIEKRRIKDWTFVQAVLSVCWAEQDKDQSSFNYFLNFATLLKIYDKKVPS